MDRWLWLECSSLDCSLCIHSSSAGTTSGSWDLWLSHRHLKLASTNPSLLQAGMICPLECLYLYVKCRRVVRLDTQLSYRNSNAVEKDKMVGGEVIPSTGWKVLLAGFPATSLHTPSQGLGKQGSPAWKVCQECESPSLLVWAVRLSHNGQPVCRHIIPC